MSQVAQISSEEIDSVVVLRVSGYLARLEVYKLKHEYDSHFDSGRRVFLLDLSRVEHIDSAGVGTLVKIRNAVAAAGGGSVAILSPTSENTRRILEVSALKTIIPFHESEAEALRAMGSGTSPKSQPPRAASSGERSDGELVLAVEELRARLQAIEFRLSRLENQK